jgi:hypothetical protein
MPERPSIVILKDLIKPLFKNKKIIRVFGNANIDMAQFEPVFLWKRVEVKNSPPIFVMKARTTDVPFNAVHTVTVNSKKRASVKPKLFLSFLFPAPALPGSGSMGIISE